MSVKTQIKQRKTPKFKNYRHKQNWYKMVKKSFYFTHKEVNRKGVVKAIIKQRYLTVWNGKKYKIIKF